VTLACCSLFCGGWCLDLLQVRTGQRVATFVLNQALVRSVSPSVFGFAAIELELLLATVLFLSREGLRLALMRTKVLATGQNTAERLAINLSWASVPVGCVVAAATGMFFTWRTSSSDELAQSKLAITLFCLGAVLETLVEPLYILSQNHLMYGLRGTLEMLAMTCRCLVTYALVQLGHGTAAFGAAQVVFAVILVAGYYGYFFIHAGQAGFPLVHFADLFPRRVAPRKRGTSAPARCAAPWLSVVVWWCGGVVVWWCGGVVVECQQCVMVCARVCVWCCVISRFDGWVDWNTVSLAIAFTQQSLFKHILTQGDRIVLTLSSSRFDQGVYGVVQNYGETQAMFVLWCLMHVVLVWCCSMPLPPPRSQRSESRS